LSGRGSLPPAPIWAYGQLESCGSCYLQGSPDRASATSRSAPTAGTCLAEESGSRPGPRGRVAPGPDVVIEQNADESRRCRGPARIPTRPSEGWLSSDASPSARGRRPAAKESPIHWTEAETSRPTPSWTLGPCWVRSGRANHGQQRLAITVTQIGYDCHLSATARLGRWPRSGPPPGSLQQQLSGENRDGKDTATAVAIMSSPACRAPS
jgi:hypothetical protein